jgi:hypothetical protein
MPTKYEKIKDIMVNHPTKGFMAHYHGPSTPSGNPMYHVYPGLMGTNAAGDQKVLGYKYNGQHGQFWRCFLVDDFDDSIQLSNVNPPDIGPVDETRQCCITNIDHT